MVAELEGRDVERGERCVFQAPALTGDLPTAFVGLNLHGGSAQTAPAPLELGVTDRCAADFEWRAAGPALRF